MAIAQWSKSLISNKFQKKISTGLSLAEKKTTLTSANCQCTFKVLYLHKFNSSYNFNNFKNVNDLYLL